MVFRPANDNNAHMRCMACQRPLSADDRVLLDDSGDYIHAKCCGPERDGYVGADGTPLKPHEPIPTGIRLGAGVVPVNQQRGGGKITMTKRLENPKRVRSRWSGEQLARCEAIISEHQAAGERLVRWGDYAVELGHPLRACYAMSSIVRSRMRAKRRAEYRAEVQAALKPMGTMAGFSFPPAPAALPPKPQVIAPPKIALDVERKNTSTQALLFAVEMRNRIAEQGITAGLLGDPPRGRSALDKMRSGVVEAARNGQRNAGSPLYVGDNRRLKDEVWRLERSLAR